MSKAEEFVNGTVVYKCKTSKEKPKVIFVGRAVSLPDGEQIIVYRPAAGEVDFCRYPGHWSLTLDELIERQKQAWQDLIDEDIGQIYDTWHGTTGTEPGAAS